MLKIIITGDFCPVFSNSGKIGENFYSKIFNGFHDSIEDKDLHITNLECPLTGYDKKILKDGPCIKADPEMIEALKYAQVDVACLANNHIMDFGARGLMDTIALCYKAGIKTVGAGKDLNEVSEPLYLSVKDRNIAIINITQHEFSSALKDKAGANPLNIIQNFYSIIEARKQSSIVLVIVHGGNEDYNLPSERIVETYRFFADAGASAVISHHSHCFSGYEVYKNVPIFYGLGNFIFECPFTDVSDSWYTGMMLLLNINSENRISFELKPFYQFKEGPGLKFLEGSEKNAVMKEIDLYSEIIKDKRKLQQKWDEFSEKSRHYYYTELTGLGNIRRKLYRIPFIRKLIFPLRRKIVLYDLIKCEAHNDVISNLLMKDINKQ